MNFNQKVQDLLSLALEQNPNIFLVDFKITTDNSIKVILDGDTESQRQGFYTNTLKKFTKENIYRTYLGKNITSVKLVEYNFKNKQLGL